MANLSLGVLEVAYSQTENGKTETKTTGDVAEILELKYGVMRYFYAAHKQDVADAIAGSVADSLADLLKGGPLRKPTFGSEQKIESLFRQFLDANEMQTLALDLTGMVISKAAAAGVSSRRKSPKAKRPSRPAFVDTGLYRSSFRAEVKL